ncbi:hypothetical protein J437_LFUL004385 [Ladona fulva]|uniref:Zinc finger CCHC domain-containing protein 7 n=1 Tax=Ladona fulva TaxID=123851 RepID=A0A8K0K1U8_LADFU|nr:hypothetical protein J437_LFUL004385 [Ladona fulva]
MEDWEEDSVIESCRSSVISDIDELEASLYGIIHHEVNEEVNESFSHALSVLPVSVGEGFWRTKEDVLDVTEQDINNSKNEEFREENETCSGQKEKEVQLQEGRGRKEEKEKDQSSVNEDLSDKRVLSNEYADSRYNVGCSNDCSKENITTTSLNTSKTVSEFSTPSKQESSSPVVIDVLSSEEEQELHPINIVSRSKKCMEEVVVLDDSDSDVMIEMEKVNVRQKKRKKISELSNDIQLNTVKYGKIRRFDKVSNPHFIESDDVQSFTPAPNSVSTPMKELDLSTICKSWTPEMIHFYEESWGGENWTLNEVLSSMSDRGWHLDVTDQFSTLSGRAQDRRYFGNSRTWCTNCNRRGHSRNECLEETRQQKCRRCGSADHSEYNCEEKICLSCGKETKYFTRACRSCRSCLDKGTACSICSVKGHVSKYCPDLWRRYHATVVPGHVVCPKKVLYKNSMNLYCCNCATKGHHVFQCKKKTFGDYIPHSPKVIKYENPSSPSRETERLAVSENWEQMRIASEYRIKETPKSRKKNKNGPKVEIPTENGNYGMLKAGQLGRTTMEYNNSIASVSTAVDPINPKKKKSKKKPTKPPEDQQNLDLNALKTPHAKQPTVRNEPSSSKNSKQSKPTNNCVDQLLSKRSSKMILSKKEYQILKTKQGEEVLKYVSKTEPGTAVTLLHTDIKMLVFIGGRKSVTRARKLMTSILHDKEAWEEITASVSGNETIGSKKCNKPKSPEAKVTSIPNESNDLRVKISNQNLQTSRDVTCLPISGPDHSQGPKNNNVIRMKNDKDSTHLEKQSKKKLNPRAFSIIQTAARNLLKGSEDFTTTKVKSFAIWALHNYGSVVNGTIRYKLRTLSKVKENGVSIEYLRKNLLGLLKRLNR